MKKRILSIVLALVLTLSMGLVAMTTASATVDSNGRYSGPTSGESKRYYFLYPTNLEVKDDDGNTKTVNWDNKFTAENQKKSPDGKPVAGGYWVDGCLEDACKSVDGSGKGPDWPGYKIQYLCDTPEGKIFYLDVSSDTTYVIFSNYIHAGTDPKAEIFSAARQTVNVGTEYYDSDECPEYPDGLESFDNMIYVINHETTTINEFNNMPQYRYDGYWYYLYKDKDGKADGTYGKYQTKEEAVANNAVKGKEIPEEQRATEATKPPVNNVPAPKDDKKSSTSDTANNGAVQTGEQAFVVVAILSILACAGVVMFARKRRV